MASTLYPYKIPTKDANYLRKVCGLKVNEDLPKAVEDIYTAFARISTRLGAAMTTTDIKLVCYIAGVGLEPPPAKTMPELWNMGELKKGEVIEVKLKRRIALDPKELEANPDQWVKARVQSYTPSRKYFVVLTVVGNARHEISHEDTRLVKEE
jgi:hypothetical protein